MATGGNGFEIQGARGAFNPRRLVLAQSGVARRANQYVLISVLGEIPPKWMPDAEALNCLQCTKSFGFTTRRHHCRACGKIFCNDCSSKKAKLAFIDNKEARVCTECFDELTKDDGYSMGAGIGKPQPDGQGGFRIHINPGNHHGASPFSGRPSSNNVNGPRPKQESNNCEECSQTFSAFRKKKPCKDCCRNFCSNCCVPSGSTSPRITQCKKCQILLTGTFSRSLLSSWKVKDLKALLNKQSVNTSKCKEKDDLIELIFIYFGGNQSYNRQTTEQELFVEQLAERMRQEEQSERQSNTQSNRPPDTTSQTAESGTQENVAAPGIEGQGTNSGLSEPETIPSPTSGMGAGDPNAEEERLQRRREQEMRETEERLRQELEAEKNSTQQDNPNLKLSDIKSEEEIENLNIKSLKRLLLNNFVDYKGCVERWELKERVKRLWIDNENNMKKADEIRKMTDDPTTAPSTATTGDDDICKICMDAAIDCVLLECGHMVTCTQCGKRLSECPICRQYVIRAVHTFRS